MHVVSCDQRSPEWYNARIGRITSSRIADALSVLKRGGESAVRRAYRLEMIYEMLTGTWIEHYVSMWMEEGTENEPLARTAYEMARGVECEQVGFVLHPKNPRFGSSPDSLVGAYGLAEFKCPKHTTHLQYILDDVVPEEYQDQMLWQMACTERLWCDFVSFHPKMPDRHQLFIKRLERDDKRIAEMEMAAAAFIAEVDVALAPLMVKHA